MIRRCKSKIFNAACILAILTSAGCSPRNEKIIEVPAPVVQQPDKPEVIEPKPQPLPAETLDSNMTLEQALAGKDIPRRIEKYLVLVNVEYWSFDGREHIGQLVIHEDLAGDVKAIFADIKEAHFPIEKMVPVSEYAWSDEASMADNNSSAFNYRSIQGQQLLSQHAHGRAIDINPRFNPYVKDGVILPPGAVYSPDIPGSITFDGPVVAAFRKRGWKWGGRWRTLKDWQHFEKSE